MSFQINGVDVPSYAHPKGNGYQYILPEPTGFTGEGKPVGAAGKPRCRVSFDLATTECWEYWAALTGEAVYANLSSVTVWNPWKSGGADWETFSTGAVLHRPTYEAISGGLYFGVEILITEIE